MSQVTASESENHGPTVRIMVDSQPHDVHRGSWIVRELKDEVGVDPSRVLDLIVDGEFKELPDDSRITIKGGEQFVSHVRQGGAS